MSLDSEMDEVVEIDVSISVQDRLQRDELASAIEKEKQETGPSRSDLQFSIRGVEAGEPSFGTFDASFWVGLLLGVPLSVPPSMIATWLCRRIDESRSRKQLSTRTSKISFGGLTITIEGQSPGEVEKVTRVLTSAIRNKTLAQRRR
jgi:hypothetical protein